MNGPGLNEACALFGILLGGPVTPFDSRGSKEIRPLLDHSRRRGSSLAAWPWSRQFSVFSWRQNDHRVHDPSVVGASQRPPERPDQLLRRGVVGAIAKGEVLQAQFLSRGRDHRNKLAPDSQATALGCDDKPDSSSSQQLAQDCDPD